jgi:hypothetical protein
MGELAFADLVAAAESGDARFPERPETGLRGEAERLDRAEALVFAEENGAAEVFIQLTMVSATSPLRPRAERLRLLSRNRKQLKSALHPENPYSGRLFGVLAAGPGPTLAKRYFEDSLTERTDSDSVIALRRALARSAYPVYAGERTWLKKVGPSQATTRWERFTDRMGAWWTDRRRDFPALIIILVILGVCVALFAGGTLPIGGIIGFAFYMFRSRNKNA